MPDELESLEIRVDTLASTVDYTFKNSASVYDLYDLKLKVDALERRLSYLEHDSSEIRREVFNAVKTLIHNFIENYSELSDEDAFLEELASLLGLCVCNAD